jgi:hypothetical protein
MTYALFQWRYRAVVAVVVPAATVAGNEPTGETREENWSGASYVKLVTKMAGRLIQLCPPCVINNGNRRMVPNPVTVDHPDLRTLDHNVRS